MSKYPIGNPYDHANPVSDQKLFVGRKKELEEIRYYLDTARSSYSPINVALLGPRASGKTSFLNIVENIGSDLDFCCVRINLDEQDSNSLFSFFFKIFDCTLRAAVDHGIYGGPTGKTYTQYLDIAFSLDVPADKLFCPFLFPVQYARAMKAGNTSNHISDQAVERDFSAIINELDKPILLLFDESNVLSENRIALQKLRNIFMNMSRAMLILTGTEDLFPVMDEVFSPIARQFHSIRIGPFVDKNETRDCILFPIQKVGLEEVEVLGKYSNSFVEDVHEFSGGKPYEIQHLCHMLFRRYQNGETAHMKFDVAGLEYVRKQLEASKGTSRQSLSRLRSLSVKELNGLGVLCRSDAQLSFLETWQMEWVFRGDERWTYTEFRGIYESLIDKNVVEEVEEKIKFAGDEFDRLYVKYQAKEKGARVAFIAVPPEFEVGIRCFRRLSVASPKKTHIVPDFLVSEYRVPQEIIKNIIKQDGGDPFEEYPWLAHNIYTKVVLEKYKTVWLVNFRFELPWVKSYNVFVLDGPVSRELRRELRKIEQRAKEVGGQCVADVFKIGLPEPEIITSRFVESSNKREKSSIAEMHLVRMTRAYITGKDRGIAAWNAEQSFCFDPNLDSNNLGYYYLVEGDLEKAETFLFRDGHLPRADPVYAYNQALLRVKQNRFKDARSSLLLAQEYLADHDDYAVTCELELLVEEGEAHFNEVWDAALPKLVATALLALDALDAEIA